VWWAYKICTKNSQPFGTNVRKFQGGGIFLTHTAYLTWTQSFTFCPYHSAMIDLLLPRCIIFWYLYINCLFLKMIKCLTGVSYQIFSLYFSSLLTQMNIAVIPNKHISLVAETVVSRPHAMNRLVPAFNWCLTDRCQSPRQRTLDGKMSISLLAEQCWVK